MANCKVCGSEFAWKKVTVGGGASQWRPFEPQKDEAGAIVYAQRPNGGGRFTKRAVPSDTPHPCMLTPGAAAQPAPAPTPKPDGALLPEPDPRFEPVYSQCNARRDGYACTRIKGHSGPHVAHHTQGRVICLEWPNEDKPEPEAVPAPVAAPVAFDPAAIKPLVRAEMVAVLDEYGVKPPARVLVVKRDGVERKVAGITHPKFERIVALFAARRHVYVKGEAGSGKTFGLGQAAEACGLRSAVVPMPGIQSAARIFGFEDANGVFRPTVFADYFENGGVFIADEFDRMMPAIAAAFNAPLENGRAVFAGREVVAHRDFVFAANGNTDMRGATMDYTSAQPLDYATAARFAYVEWGYHEPTESAIVESVVPAPVAVEVTTWVRALRAEVARQQVDKLLCGPRESLRIAEELARGTSFEDAAETWIRRGLPEDAWRMLTRAAGPYPKIRVKEAK